jgi:hypothetical protein
MRPRSRGRGSRCRRRSRGRPERVVGALDRDKLLVGRGRLVEDDLVRDHVHGAVAHEDERRHRNALDAAGEAVARGPPVYPEDVVLGQRVVFGGPNGEERQEVPHRGVLGGFRQGVAVLGGGALGGAGQRHDLDRRRAVGLQVQVLAVGAGEDRAVGEVEAGAQRVLRHAVDHEGRVVPVGAGAVPDRRERGLGIGDQLRWCWPARKRSKKSAP